MAKTLETLIELSQVLDDLKTSHHKIEDVPDSMKELHEQFQAHKSKVDELIEIEEAAELERRASEGESAELQSKVDHYQEQIPKVTTQREYGALLSEIDTAKEKKRELEEAALAALERLDVAKTEREALEAEFKSIDEQYQSQLAAWEGDKPAVKKQIKKLKGQSEVLQESLPKVALRQFERVVERSGGKPMTLIQVIIQAGRTTRKIYSCSGCNYEVRPQVVVDLRSVGEIQLCDGCGRIFYLDDSE